MRSKLGLLGLIVALVVSTGCTAVQEGFVAGAAAGGAAGAWYGTVAGGVHTAEGAAAGAAVGGIIGALTADALAEEEDLEALIEERDRYKAALEKCQANCKDLEAKNAELKRRIAALEARIAAMGRTKGKEVARGVISSDTLFHPGSDALTAKGKKALDQAANEIKKNYRGKDIAIEGHTDSAPISKSHWKSNWELGSARALAVMHYLIETHSIPAGKLSATSYADTKPIASNDTKERMASNRRAEIVVYAKQ